MSTYNFRVEFMEDVKTFLDGIDGKSREKIIYNIWKARSTNDKELFKNYKMKFGSSGLSIKKLTTDFLHFGINHKRMIQWLFQRMA